MSTKGIVYIALFAALTAARGSFPPILLPVTGVPITAQSISVMLAGSILGARRGGLAIVLFLILVAVGLPLLAGGKGGIGVVYAGGIPRIAVIADISIVQAAIGSAAYLPGDVVKVALTALVAMTVKRSYLIITARA